jgi:F-type H+-transporting ATPase subunit alpha
MASQSNELSSAARATLEVLRQARESYKPRLAFSEIGIVTSVSEGIAYISGLPGVGYEELVEFDGGVLGLAFDLDDESVSCVLLDDESELRAGTHVKRTFRAMDVPVGDKLLGRVITPTRSAPGRQRSDITRWSNAYRTHGTPNYGPRSGGDADRNRNQSD